MSCWLQEYCLIALDVYRKNPYAKGKDELNGWIGLLATENVEEAEWLMKEYPWLEEIYEEATEYMKKPEEVLGMFSEALRILDRNMVHYMIEEQQKQIEEKDRQISEQIEQISEQAKQLKEKDKKLIQLQAELEQLKHGAGGR